jgi:hypothetical protein
MWESGFGLDLDCGSALMWESGFGLDWECHSASEMGCAIDCWSMWEEVWKSVALQPRNCQSLKQKDPSTGLCLVLKLPDVQSALAEGRNKRRKTAEKPAASPEVGMG